MRKSLRSLMAVLILAALAGVFAAPVAAAPVERPFRTSDVTGVEHLGALVSELYAGIRGWMEGWVPQSLSAASGGDMDPNGTAPTSSEPTFGTATTDGGGQMDPNG